MPVLATTLDAAKSSLEKFEKNIPWLYLDNASPQRVTVGVGNMLANAKDAEALWDKFEVMKGYSKKTTNKSGMETGRKLDEYSKEYFVPKAEMLKFSSKIEQEKWMKGVIAKVYKAVKQAANPKWGAYAYLDANKVSDPTYGEIWLRFKKSEAVALMRGRVDKEFIPQLRGKLIDPKGNPYYHQLPPEAQQALIDLVYNTGIDNLLAFENMLKAIQAKNWKAAAEESRRGKVEPERNQYVKELFLKLAEASPTPEVVHPKRIATPLRTGR
jgi:GH24 family phage-related lysozyme (muramidase)